MDIELQQILGLVPEDSPPTGVSEAAIMTYKITTRGCEWAPDDDFKSPGFPDTAGWIKGLEEVIKKDNSYFALQIAGSKYVGRSKGGMAVARKEGDAEGAGFFAAKDNSLGRLVVGFYTSSANGSRAEENIKMAANRGFERI